MNETETDRAAQVRLERACLRLTEREEQVVRLRQGLVPDARPRPFDAVGARFGITAERARQIHARAMRTLGLWPVVAPGQRGLLDRQRLSALRTALQAAWTERDETSQVPDEADALWVGGPDEELGSAGEDNA